MAGLQGELSDCKDNLEMDHLMYALKQIRDEYEIKAEKMQRTLQQFDTFELMSEKNIKNLKETAELLQASGVNEINTTDIFIQETTMALEESQLKRKQLKFQGFSKEFSRKCADLKQRTEDLRRDMVQARKEYEVFKEGSESKLVETKYLQDQAEKYKKQLEKLKAEQQRLDIPDPQELKEMLHYAEAIKQMKNEISELRFKHEKYEGLPPDLELAKKMLDETKQKNEQLKERLKAQIMKQRNKVTDLDCA